MAPHQGPAIHVKGLKKPHKDLHVLRGVDVLGWHAAPTSGSLSPGAPAS